MNHCHNKPGTFKTKYIDSSDGLKRTLVVTMNSCDVIRECSKAKSDAPSPMSPLNRLLLHRKGSERHSHHKSHEVLSEYSKCDKPIAASSPTKCEASKCIDRKDKSKRNSRSEDNLLGLQKSIQSSPSGQIILTQDFFTVSGNMLMRDNYSAEHEGVVAYLSSNNPFRMLRVVH